MQPVRRITGPIGIVWYWVHLPFLYHLQEQQESETHPFLNPEKTFLLLDEVIQEVLEKSWSLKKKRDEGYGPLTKGLCFVSSSES